MKLIIALILGVIVSFGLYKKDVFAHKEKSELYEAGAGVVTAAIAFALLTLFAGGSPADVADEKLAVDNDVKVIEKAKDKDVEKPKKKDKEDVKEDDKKKVKDDEKKDVNEKEESNKEADSKKADNKKAETTKNTANSNVKTQNKGSSTKPSAPSAPSKKPAQSKPSAPKVEYKTVKEKIDLQYETQYVDNYDLAKGQERVTQEGKNGYELHEKKYKIENGKQTLVSSNHLETVSPVNKVVEVGKAMPLEYNHELSKALFNETNAYRRKNGMPELKWNDNLSKAAMVRAKEIRTSYSHTRPDGSPLSSVYREFNIPIPKSAGENIAGGLDARSVVAAWSGSAGHNKNMLSDVYTELGVGVYGNEHGYYWVQLFVG